MGNGDAGDREQSAAIHETFQRDVSIIRPVRKATLSPGSTGRSVQYFDQIADDADDLVSKNLCHALTLRQR